MGGCYHLNNRRCLISRLFLSCFNRNTEKAIPFAIKNYFLAGRSNDSGTEQRHNKRGAGIGGLQRTYNINVRY